MANKRFEVKETQGVLSTGRIIVDTEIGKEIIYYTDLIKDN